MDVRELLSAVRYLRDLVQRNNLKGRYKALSRAVTEAGQNQNPEKVNQLLEELKQVLNNADLSTRGLADLDLLKQFGVASMVGPEAAARLDQIFRNHAANPQAIIAELQALMPPIDELSQRTDALTNALNPMLDASSPDKPTLTGELGYLWLRFDHKVAIDTMQDLPKAVDKWNTILHHFSRVIPGTDSTAKLIHIQKSNPLVLEVAATVALLGPITWGVNRVVQSLGNVVDLGKKVEELKQMKVKTSVLEGLAEQIKESRTIIASEAANEVQQQFQCDNEARNAVEVALKEVVGFLEGGGAIDIELAEDTTPKGDGEKETPPAIDGQRLKTLIEGMRRDLLALPPQSE
jgi:hypothetical protein